MMMGQGSFGYGGGSSNLSALAPPFTVDRSVPKPLVDLTEPTSYHHSLHNWVNPHQPEFDYFFIQKPELDSNSYNRYSASSNPHVSVSTDSVLYGQSGVTGLEAKPYYPSTYISPAIGNDCSLGGVPHHSDYGLLSASRVSTSIGSSEDYTQSLSGQWSGMWDGLTDWLQSEQVQLDGSFCSKETYMNQVAGLYASESTSKYEASQSADTVGRETQIESAGVGKLDYKSFLGENRKFTPSDYPTPSSLASTLLVPETCSQVPSKKAVNSWNHHMPYSASNEKCLRRHDATSSDIATILYSSPAVVIKPPEHNKGSLKNVNTSSDGDNKDFSCNSPSVVVEPRPFITSKGSVCYDASQVSFHLGKTDQVIANFSSAKNEELSSNQNASMDVSGHFAGEKPVIQVPCTSLGGISLVDKNEAIDPAKNHTESLDHYNPAVDSPCWKGAPVSNFSQLEVSEAVTPQNMKNLEACSGSNHQGYQTFSVSSDDAVKVSPEKTSEKSIQQKGWSLENYSASSMKRPLADNMLHREGIDHFVNFGANCTKPSLFHQVQISDDALPNKSFDDSNGKLPQNEKQSCESGKWTTESNSAPVISVADVGMNMNDDPDECSSHVPFHAVEHVLSSPPSADSASIKLTKACGGVSTQKTYIRTVIDTMQNLSELLIFHLSNDLCDLKEDDSNALKGMISNLELCMLKNVERMTSTQESIIPERDGAQLSGKSSKLQKGTNGNGFLISRSDPLEFQYSVKYQHVQDEHNISSGKNDETLSSYVSVRAAADMLKRDKMTQAIKNALTENFHGEEETEPQVLLYKNLWLEAEASLCYASCMARFNRIKSEMEKCDSEKANGSPENCMVEEKLSKSNIRSDPCTGNVLASNTKGSPLPDTSIPESSILCTSSHADDVTARYHILKYRVDSTNAVNTSSLDKMLGSADKLSSSQFSPCPNNVEKGVCEEKDGQKPDISIQDSLVSNTTSHLNDVEASVMARFHILKCRDDNFSMHKEESTESVDLGYVGLPRHWPTGTDETEDRVLDVNMRTHLQHHDCNFTEDKLPVKEFHLFVKDDPVIGSRDINRLGDQSHASFCDGSSDWEHVLLEELGQTVEP
ncbi:uncharacterized protein LOC8283697 isoform X1 [Ricinus communis]|uniref:uncharacterized protein LOC8283697 isoform X1 n=1 Tax=Ricinus communis TaxID=3988 RepID=UPI00201B0EF5|nr:uncharacterized protein LOC8283697 isoform X1 [Ricinus communis]